MTTTNENYYGTPEDHARVERAKRDELALNFKRRLWSRQRKGDVKIQSGPQYASAVLGRSVKHLDELTEEDFASLMLALNGGKNE